jgi:hypothetical protein
MGERLTVRTPQVYPPVDQEHRVGHLDVGRDVEWLATRDFGGPERRCVCRAEVEQAVARVSVRLTWMENGLCT